MCRRASLQYAPPSPLATLYTDSPAASTDAIACASSVVQHQRIQGPVRLGAHADSPVGSDENRHRRTRVPMLLRSRRRVEDTLGLFGKSAHSVLIGTPGVNSMLIAPLEIRSHASA